jgi:predicted DCC family thiol-disulfide oxidoreductase YuxK
MSEDETHVLYNAACPVCAAEIDHYRRAAGRAGRPLRFHDLNGAGLSGWGVGRDAAARRLHVRHRGRVLSGVPAFIAIWSELPRYRWLARVVTLPGVRHSAEWLYDRVLAPALYRRHLRRTARCRG